MQSCVYIYIYRYICMYMIVYVYVYEKRTCAFTDVGLIKH